MNVHTFPTEAGADTVSLHWQAILLIEAESSQKAVEDEKDMKQVGYDYCFCARPVGNGISNGFGVERSSYPNGVSSCFAIEREQFSIG